MAGIKQPLLDILNLLSSISVSNLSNQQVKLYARIWNNQVKFESEGKTYNYPKPAAFLEVVDSPVYEEMGQYFQDADITWRIHLVHEMYDAQNGTMEQDLVIFDLRDLVVRTLTAFEATACSPMIKKSEQQEYDHANVYHYVIDFTSNFIDSTGSPYDPNSGEQVLSGAPVNLNLTVNIEDPLPDEPGSFPETNDNIQQTRTKYQIPQ